MKVKFMILAAICLVASSCAARREAVPFQLNDSAALMVSPELSKGGVIELNNTICPLMGKPSKSKRTFIYKEVEYRFCCYDCLKMMKKNPEFYALPEDQIQALKAQLHG